MQNSELMINGFNRCSVYRESRARARARAPKPAACMCERVRSREHCCKPVAGHAFASVAAAADSAQRPCSQPGAMADTIALYHSTRTSCDHSSASCARDVAIALSASCGAHRIA